MSIFNNQVGIYLSDEKVLLFNPDRGLISGPMCIFEKNYNKQIDYKQIDYNLYYPVSGSVVADYWSCRKILKQYLRFILPIIHFKTKAYFVISPVTSGFEYYSIKNLCQFHKIYFSLEPIVLLYSLDKKNGIVVSLHRTMLEISLVENLELRKYRWEYITGLYQNGQYLEIYHRIGKLLSELDRYVCTETDCIYFTGDSDLINKVFNLAYREYNKFEFEIIPSTLIVRNIINSPKVFF